MKGCPEKFLPAGYLRSIWVRDKAWSALENENLITAHDHFYSIADSFNIGFMSHASHNTRPYLLAVVLRQFNEIGYCRNFCFAKFLNDEQILVSSE